MTKCARNVQDEIKQPAGLDDASVPSRTSHHKRKWTGGHGLKAEKVFQPKVLQAHTYMSTGRQLTQSLGVWENTADNPSPQPLSPNPLLTPIPGTLHTSTRQTTCFTTPSPARRDDPWRIEPLAAPPREAANGSLSRWPPQPERRPMAH